MSDYTFYTTEIDDVLIIDNFFVGDIRGGFTKTFERDVFMNAGISFKLNETFASVSMKNVVRGLHFQTDSPQAKLVNVLKGKVWDVIVDLRQNSNTYKKWLGVDLSSENHKGIFIPRGFAHGFVSLEDDTVMLYQCDGKYDKKSDGGIILDDKDINIEWPIALEKMIRSKRDMELPNFKEYEKNPMKLG